MPNLGFNGISAWDFVPKPPRQELPLVTERRLINHKFGSRLAEYLNLSMEQGPWLAGGAVRKIYLGQDIGHSDWDIWFRNAEQYDRSHKLVLGLGADVAYSSDNATTFKYEFEGETHNIQLIRRRFFDSAEQVINQFDFTICQLITDGRTLKIGRQTAQDLDQKLIRSVSINLQSYIIPRLVKYMVYGYYPCRELIEDIESQAATINWQETQIDYDAS